MLPMMLVAGARLAVAATATAILERSLGFFEFRCVVVVSEGGWQNIGRVFLALVEYTSFYSDVTPCQPKHRRSKSKTTTTKDFDSNEHKPIESAADNPTEDD